MAKKKPEVPKYGTITLKGIQYYRTRIMDADGKQVSLYATTCEELYEKELEARRQVEEIIFHRQRLYEGHEKLYHQTLGRDVYGGGHFG